MLLHCEFKQPVFQWRLSQTLLLNQYVKIMCDWTSQYIAVMSLYVYTHSSARMFLQC